MPRKTATDRLKAHRKKYNQIQEKKKLEEREKGKPVNERNLQSELWSAAWDLKHRQYPMSKKKHLEQTIKERIKENKGVITQEVKECRELLERYIW